MLRFKLHHIGLLIAGSSLLIAFRWFNPMGNPVKEQVLMEMILNSIKNNHYSPEMLDDAFSEHVFDLYLKRIDNSKRIFLQEDIDRMRMYRDDLDDEAKSGKFDFFTSAMATYEKRVETIKGFYTDILSTPFDLSVSETIETDGEKMSYAKTEEELRERWRKNLKYQVLLRVEAKLDEQEKAQEKKDTSVTIKTVQELEKEARERVLKTMNDWAKSLEQEDREDQLAFYLETFVNVNEPHTGYFPPLEKQNFDIRMSGKLEGIGAQLRQEDGYIKVVNIVPGSASARQGELQVNDKIIKVAQAKEEPVDVVDMKIDDVLPLIRGKKGTEVRLTVRKPDGTIKIIPIVRDVVVLEESYAKSAIIEHAKTKTKVGLIDLRSFYADFADAQGRRCSKDVRQEVQKLIAEGVDGIVIDLRFNGGGSLSDVVEMSGYFIERGPVVQVKNREGSPILLEDRDPNVLYKGPLVILVNSFSASASEIMAAALQDYGRAIVVGTAPTTFGKGTVQRFFELPVPSKYKEQGVDELGSLKITIQKFYRINGGSTQLEGVKPDIILPGAYSYIKVGEQEEDYPMEYDKIDAAKYQLDDTATKILDKVKKKSQKRVAGSEAFRLLEENAQWLKSQQDRSEYTLNLEDYIKLRKNDNKEAERFKAVEKEIADLNVRSLAADLAHIEADSSRASSAKTWYTALKKDAYLEEVVHIISDWK